MAIDHILALLASERDKLTRAIEALTGPTKRRGRPVGSGRKAVVPSIEQDLKVRQTAAPKLPAKRKLSAEGRKAISIASKKRWAAIKAAKAAATSPVPVAAKQKTSPAKDAAFRKKMSERMKAAWAARKKKAAGKDSIKA